MKNKPIKMLLTLKLCLHDRTLLVALELHLFMQLSMHKSHGLLNTWPYMSYLKAKIKRPVFQKNSIK